MKETILSFARTSEGASTNVPVLVVHHSPSGFEWGYGGSGPADLALNILEFALRLNEYEGPLMQTWDGRNCFRASWAMHQSFKRQIVAKIPFDGCTIDLADVTAWIDKNMPAKGTF